MCIICFNYSFRFHFFICIICINICSSHIWNWYYSFKKHVCITVIKKTRLQNGRLEPDLIISVVYSTHLIVKFNPDFSFLNLDGWLLVLFRNFFIFWQSILSLYIYSYDYNNRSLSVICCRLSVDTYLSLDIPINVSSICTDFLNLIKASWVVFEATF